MGHFLSIILWVGIFFVLMRFGHFATGMKSDQMKSQNKNLQNNNSNHELVWTPPEKDIDPVCNKSVVTDTAKPSVHNGKVYYFCSRTCRERFEAAPDLYVGGQFANQQQMEQTHA